MNHGVKKGFTIIELMLAMTFISLLLLAIALTILQIGRIYNKGITVNQVNSAAQSIAVELQRSIETGGEVETNILGNNGRLCLGQYSYVWNYGKVLDEDSDKTPIKYQNPNGGIPLSFVKVADSGGSYCHGVNKIDMSKAVELLPPGDHNLAIHQFSITESSRDEVTGQVLYMISFTIGTNDQHALNTDQSGCKTPDQPNADPEYCYVQRFSIAVRG